MMKEYPPIPADPANLTDLRVQYPNLMRLATPFGICYIDELGSDDIMPQLVIGQLEIIANAFYTGNGNAKSQMFEAARDLALLMEDKNSDPGFFYQYHYSKGDDENRKLIGRRVAVSTLARGVLRQVGMSDLADMLAPVHLPKEPLPDMV